MFKCFDPWSKDPRPDASCIGDFNGKFIFEGHSQVAGFGNLVKLVDGKSINIARGGDQTWHVLEQFKEVRQEHEKYGYEKAYIHIGENDFIISGMVPHGKDLVQTVFDNIRKIIEDYCTIIPAESIIIPNFSYIDPAYKVKDTWAYRAGWMPDYFDPNLELNHVFAYCNGVIDSICADYGVKRLDIYSVLYYYWKTEGKKYWWDQLHFANQCQLHILATVKGMWGL